MCVSFFLSCDLCDVCDAQAMNKVLCEAEATDRAMRAKHCDVFQPDSDPITNETVAESVAKECRKDTGEDDVVGGPGCPRRARAVAAAKPAAMAEAAKPAAHHRRAARRAAARLLLRVHRHLSNAIACMLATSVGECTEKCPAGKDPADHLIDVYEREVRLFCEALGEWAPENTGMILSQSGARLYNWPLHCMSEVREAPPHVKPRRPRPQHVPTMMRHLKKAANMMIGVVTTQVRAAMAGLARAAGLGMILGLHAYHTRAPLQITERTNTFLKAALVNTRRRAIGVRVDCEEALLRTSHLYQVRCDCSSCLQHCPALSSTVVHLTPTLPHTGGAGQPSAHASWCTRPP